MIRRLVAPVTLFLIVASLVELGAMPPRGTVRILRVSWTAAGK